MFNEFSFQSITPQESRSSSSSIAVRFSHLIRFTVPVIVRFGGSDSALRIQLHQVIAISDRWARSPVWEMITRSKLVEQLRDYQIRSQRKCRVLIVFSPKTHLTSWFALLFLLQFRFLSVGIDRFITSGACGKLVALLFDSWDCFRRCYSGLLSQLICL